jgi:hypothetical protein
MGHKTWKARGLYRRVVFKVIYPDGKSEKTVSKAPRGQAFPLPGIEQLIERMINALDTKYPNWDFRMVKVEDNRYTFVYIGERPTRSLEPEATTVAT